MLNKLKQEGDISGH